MNRKQGYIISIVMGVLFVIAFALLGRKTALLTGGNKVTEDKAFMVILDAGHGGIDPGKVGIHGEKEKDINLAITLKLQKFLESEDVKVVLTRDSDLGLYDENAKNKKVQDMKRRLAIINDKKPDMTVSIHQNSYPQESVQGAQVFYYGESVAGKKLAEMMQRQLIIGIDPENHRDAKANESYYLLKKTETPLIIVECGFLSNDEEAKKLADTYFQEKLAWNMHLAILQYLNTKD